MALRDIFEAIDLAAVQAFVADEREEEGPKLAVRRLFLRQESEWMR